MVEGWCKNRFDSFVVSSRRVVPPLREENVISTLGVLIYGLLTLKATRLCIQV